MGVEINSKAYENWEIYGSTKDKWVDLLLLLAYYFVKMIVLISSTIKLQGLLWDIFGRPTSYIGDKFSVVGQRYFYNCS